MTKREKYFFIALFSATIGIIVITIMNRPSLTTHFINYTNTFPDRYYYGQSLMVTLCIVLLISELARSFNKIYKFIGLIISILLTIIYIVNLNLIFEFIYTRTPKPTLTFADRVNQAFDANVIVEKGKPEYIVKIESEGWNMWLPESNVISTVALQRSPNYINVFNNSDENSNLGIKKDDNILLFQNTKFNKYFLTNAKQFKCGNIVKNVFEINYVDNKWIWVTLEDKENIELFSYPNKIQVIK